MERGYQTGFSSKSAAMFDVDGRQHKARTMVAVLEDYFDGPVNQRSVLNVGGSAGIIDDYLSRHFKSVVGIDIDADAIEHAQRSFSNPNLTFEAGDAMNLRFAEGTFDVVISSQVYEHVPDAGKMMEEIYRVLKPGGVCYFAASNRLRWNEPHYDLPLLSVIPRPLAHLYMRLARKGDFYYEKHLSYWGLKRLIRRYSLLDYTRAVIERPERFATDYMIRPGSAKARLAAFVAKYFLWAAPGYIWVLRKPDPASPR
ncbi:MAG: class I SAM-dependent methyltransferase [Gammaproteobacteria bacterium]|nr:class I SAM-dependent methyltransferase [Gammaproteobacteria bacterium]